MKTHKLKTWHEYFQPVWTGDKFFELRKNDRDFKEGDKLELHEYFPLDDRYSGRWIECTVGYILYGGVFGLPDDMCIMSIGNPWHHDNYL